jgi:hypothetical protein
VTAAATRPAYRAPWTHGAKAYPEADTLDAMWQGVARKRSPLTVHVAHAGLVGQCCAGCGLPFDAPYPVSPHQPDELTVDRLGYAYVDVSPRKGEAVARHYYCAWGAVMADVMKLRRAV